MSDLALFEVLGMLGFCLYIAIFLWWLSYRDRPPRRPVRRVAREVWGPMREKYFANKKAGTRPPEGL